MYNQNMYLNPNRIPPDFEYAKQHALLNQIGVKVNAEQSTLTTEMEEEEISQN